MSKMIYDEDIAVRVELDVNLDDVETIAGKLTNDLPQALLGFDTFRLVHPVHKYPMKWNITAENDGDAVIVTFSGPLMIDYTVVDTSRAGYHYETDGESCYDASICDFEFKDCVEAAIKSICPDIEFEVKVEDYPDDETIWEYISPDHDC